MRKWVLSVMAATVGIAFLPGPVDGQGLKVVGEIRSSGPVTSETSRKIASHLRGLIADFGERRVGEGTANAVDVADRFSSDLLKVDGAGRVQVYVWVTDTGEQALGILSGLSLDVELVNKDFGILQGWIPVSNLERLAAEPLVLKIRPPSYGSAGKGAVATQGDSIHRCDQARSLGFDGSGVKVGIISDGVAGLAASQAAGELGPVQVLSAGTGDEGTAMLEIVADCAPGATLAFAAGLPTSLEFVQAVNGLRDAGSQIIADDLYFLGEPYFEDGVTAMNDRVVGASLLRVTLAGNAGRAHYQAMFNPGSFDADPAIMGTRHNFGGGDELLRFQLAGGARARVFLQWSNRFGAAADDYDLCVRFTNGTLLACSTLVQGGGDDPLEVVVVNCSAPAPGVCLADIQITRFSGATQLLELFCDPCVFNEFNDRAGSITGHSAVPEVLTVSASPASSPGTVESYSSAGPSLILFPTIESRAKPELNGIDCVATSRPAPFNVFCGTSAATPHVAAVAAILLQRMGPGTSVQALAGALVATATDLGTSGFDSNFGFGRADALSAVQSPLLDPGLVAAVLPNSRSVQVGVTATVFGAVGNTGFVTAQGCSIAPVTNLPGAFGFQATDSATNRVTGNPNAPFTITGRAIQTFVLAFTPSAPFAPTEVQLNFTCTNATPAPVFSGLDTVLLSASATPVPDIVALVATANNDGIVNVAGSNGTGVFAVATVNVGESGSITAVADTGVTALPLTLRICETDPGTGACRALPSPTVTTTVNAGATPTFGLFVSGNGAVPFDPSANRIFVRFKDAGGVTRGSTSVAVRTQ